MMEFLKGRPCFEVILKYCVCFAKTRERHGERGESVECEFPKKQMHLIFRIFALQEFLLQAVRLE